MKKFTIKFQTVSGILVLSLFSTQFAFAAGLEKTLLWSGHYNGIAAAAAGVVTGPESLYFNPAGLAGSEGTQFSINGAFTGININAPIVPGGNIISTGTNLAIPFSALASYELSPKASLGIGVYIAGGNKTIYNNVDFTPLNAGFSVLAPTVQSSLALTEFSLGGGYELLEGLKVGAAYRVSYVTGTLGAAQATDAAGNASTSPTTLTAVTIDNLKTTNYGGFRVGVQYIPKEAGWGLGVEWRSAVEFNLKGTSSGSTVSTTGAASGVVIPLTGGTTTVTNTLPQELSLGGFYDINSIKTRVFAEYTFTEYSVDRAVTIVGTLRTTGAVITLPNVNQNWQNQSNYKFAFEYGGITNLALRGGYIYTTQVTPTGTANPTFASPSATQTLVLGAGAGILSNLTADAAFEYSFASGTAPLPGTATTQDFKSSAYALHIGATYKM